MSRPPIEAAFERGFNAWEESLSQLTDRALRDPRLIRFGADLLRSQLLWMRSWQSACQAMLGPLPGPVRR